MSVLSATWSALKNKWTLKNYLGLQLHGNLKTKIPLKCDTNNILQSQIELQF